LRKTTVVGKSGNYASIISRLSNGSWIYVRNYGQQRAISLRPEVVQANFKNLYPDLEPPTLYFITKTLREGGLTTGGKKRGKNRSR
jgi:hypothetical protein